MAEVYEDAVTEEFHSSALTGLVVAYRKTFSDGLKVFAWRDIISVAKQCQPELHL